MLSPTHPGIGIAAALCIAVLPSLAHLLHQKVDQEADDETRDWLDNMMSNSVSAKKAAGPAAAAAAASAALVEKHRALQRRDHADSRAMRKTLILRTGTADSPFEACASGPCAPLTAWNGRPVQCHREGCIMGRRMQCATEEEGIQNSWW